MITSMGIGTGSLDLNLSLSSFTMNTTTMITSAITMSHTLLLVICVNMLSRVYIKGREKYFKDQHQLFDQAFGSIFDFDYRNAYRYALTYMMAKGPLKPGTSSPRTNLSWETRMWMAAAVVKPDTKLSERYMTTKPTCRTPMASWRSLARACGIMRYMTTSTTQHNICRRSKI